LQTKLKSLKKALILIFQKSIFLKLNKSNSL
jgi:hypothetical protein